MEIVRSILSRQNLRRQSNRPSLFQGSVNAVESAAAVFNHQRASVIRQRQPTGANIALDRASNIVRAISKTVHQIRWISENSSAPK